ncbi:MAG: DUF4159 domain-containing protein [Vicinamibacterales bacterium]
MPAWWSGRRKPGNPAVGIRRAGTAAIAVALVVSSLAVVQAQRIFSGFYGFAPPKFPTATTYDGQFNFCRAYFESDRREKQGWGTDYPGADLNFSTRLAELTKVPVKRVLQGTEMVPDAVVVRLTDDWLFKCSFLLMEDAGTARFSEAEVERLRAYLLKGGFLLSSDYHGSYAKAQFDEEIGRVLPHGEFPIIDLTPPDHPIWHTMFGVTRIPQMASIQTWRRSGKSTIERWNEDGSPPDVRGIADEKGRLMVVMVHNTDLPDPWEREGEESEYFFRFSPEAYRVGIDILIYALTH